VALDGILTDEETQQLIQELEKVGNENLGMAMTFTLVSHLRERLSSLVTDREERRIKNEVEMERLALEAEEARTRGTPVTVETFTAWKVKFDQELRAKKVKEEEEKTKGMSAKEREEYKRLGSRLSGRQLFERNKNLDEEGLLEEGDVSVDTSQYERTREHEEEEDERVTFSDSD
jgi:hypothetical protein